MNNFIYKWILKTSGGPSSSHALTSVLIAPRQEISFALDLDAFGQKSPTIFARAVRGISMENA